MTCGSAGLPSAERLESLQANLGYEFKNRSLLIDALTHSSFINESAGVVSNERMEFLGDSILSFVTAQYLYSAFPQDEGRLSQMRSVLVNENSLHRIADEYGICKCMRLGGSLKSELARTGHVPRSILSDCVEALIAAVFLDGGYDSVFAVTMRMVDFLVSKADVFEDADDKDYKSLLQEFVQKRTHELPVYNSSKIETDNKEMFEVSLFVSGKFVCKHTSSSIRKAQRECAKDAYEKAVGGHLI